MDEYLALLGGSKFSPVRRIGVLVPKCFKPFFENDIRAVISSAYANYGIISTLSWRVTVDFTSVGGSGFEAEYG